MSETENIESVVTSITETPAVAETTTTEAPGSTPAEAQNTETPGQENTVPSFRLKEEADKRRAAEEELARLKAEMEQSATPEEQEVYTPPADVTDERERARLLIANDSIDAVEKALGMTLAEAKAQLSTAGAVGKDYAQRQWEASCAKHGLDPNNNEVAEMVMGLAKGANVPLDTAFERAKKVYGNGQQAPAKPTATVGQESVTPVMSESQRIPSNKREAMEMAAKGERAPVLSSQEIVAARMERQAANKR
jgi:hypothetical protein